MAENSKIEWTDHTGNLWKGCSKVHAGCVNCYAETLSNRFKENVWGNDKPRMLVKSFFPKLDSFQKKAEKENTIKKVFVGSMMDIFEKPMPMIDHNQNVLEETNTGVLRKLFFDQVSKGVFPNLIFLFLTKRPSNINKYIPEEWKDNTPKNVWFGCSPVDQETYNNFFGHMMKVNGNTFYSIEPQLGGINLNSHDKVKWIIQGGESGANRRPFDLNWAEQMRAQCSTYNIPYFFKQIDKVIPIPEHMMIREFPMFQTN